METINTIGTTNINLINIESANPIFLCQVERDYLSSYGFLIVKLTGGLLGIIQTILMQIAIWIILLPGGLSVVLFYYDLLYIATRSSLFPLIISLLILVGLYKISLILYLYSSTRYMYISTGENENIYIFGGKKEQTEWNKIMNTLKGEGWINELNYRARSAINVFSGLAIITLFSFLPITFLIMSFFIGGIIIFSKRNFLYAFGNLGEKIQKLTPQIVTQSKAIEENFVSDMNFSVISDGFDSLSTTFSEIVSLVIKLEKVEARANKGNLFDSEKYINSLRSDIINPLNSLKAFLDKQKIELLESQKELSQVQIGGIESTGNIELESKRSESIIRELTSNIEKLDIMIGKMA